MLLVIWMIKRFSSYFLRYLLRLMPTGYFLLQFLPKIIIFETCSKPEGFVLILKILPLWLFRQSKQKTVKLLRFTSVKNWDSNQIWQSFVYPAKTAKAKIKTRHLVQNNGKNCNIQGVPYLTFILWLASMTILQTFRP